MTWKDQLIKFIEEQSGSYQDTKWQFEYFEEFKVIGVGENKKSSSKHANLSKTLQSTH